MVIVKLEDKKFNEIVLDAKKYRPDEYQIFKDKSGWTDWIANRIDEYIDVEEDEPVDLESIEKILKDAFEIAHNVRFTYTLLSEDMKPAYESTEQFETIEDLKKDVEKYGNLNYRIYSIDEYLNFEEIETVDNV